MNPAGAQEVMEVLGYDVLLDPIPNVTLNPDVRFVSVDPINERFKKEPQRILQFLNDAGMMEGSAESPHTESRSWLPRFVVIAALESGRVILEDTRSRV